MKKILSISVVALLAMAPTLGWAVPDTALTEPANNESYVDDRVRLADHPIIGSEQDAVNTTLNENPELTYVTARSSDAHDGLSDEYGYREGRSGIVSIVTTQEPRYNVEYIEENDGKRVAAVSYVKGAYNDLITKINKVSSQDIEPGELPVYTTWGKESTVNINLKYGDFGNN